MEPLNLRVKFKDSLAMALKNLWLPVLLGIGLAAYQGNLSPDSFLFISAIIIGAIAFSALLGWATPYLELTEGGINFKNWRGRDELCSWDSEITFELKKHGSTKIYSLTNVSLNKSYKIPTVLFSYPETQNYINAIAPKEHPLRGLSNASS